MTYRILHNEKFRDSYRFWNLVVLFSSCMDGWYFCLGNLWHWWRRPTENNSLVDIREISCEECHRCNWLSIVSSDHNSVTVSSVVTEFILWQIDSSIACDLSRLSRDIPFVLFHITPHPWPMHEFTEHVNWYVTAVLRVTFRLPKYMWFKCAETGRVAATSHSNGLLL